MSAENPGEALAQRTVTPPAENEIDVVPPTRVNVSVWAGAGVGDGAAVADGLGVGRAEGLAVGVCVGRPVAVGFGVGVDVEPGRGVDVAEGVAGGTAVASARGEGDGRGTTVDRGRGVALGRRVGSGVGARACGRGVGVRTAPAGSTVGVGIANPPLPDTSPAGALDSDESAPSAASAAASCGASVGSDAASTDGVTVTAEACASPVSPSVGAAAITSELERTRSKCDAGWITASSTKLTPCHATSTAAPLAANHNNTNIAGLTRATMADRLREWLNRGSNLVAAPRDVDCRCVVGSGA